MAAPSASMFNYPNQLPATIRECWERALERNQRAYFVFHCGWLIWMIMYCSLGYNTTALNNEAALDSRYLSSRLVASNKAGIASLGNKKMISVWEETDARKYPTAGTTGSFHHWELHFLYSWSFFQLRDLKASGWWHPEVMKHVGEGSGERPEKVQNPHPKGTLNTHEPAICLQGFRKKLGSTQGTESEDSWRALPVWGFSNIPLFLLT